MTGIDDNDYLRRILTADVYDIAVETPLDDAPSLSARTGNRVLLKREDLQPVFSFKVRGAYNKMAKLSPEQRGESSAPQPETTLKGLPSPPPSSAAEQ